MRVHCHKSIVKKKKLFLDKDDIVLTFKEQLFYYEIFRKRFGRSSTVYNDNSGKQYPKYKWRVKTKTAFSKICESYRIWQENLPVTVRPLIP